QLRAAASAATMPRRGRRLAWTAAAVLLVTGFLVWLSFLINSRSQDDPWTARLMTNVGDVVAAAISPDGRYIAYARKGAGGQDLWLMLTATGGTKQIVPPESITVLGISFSPDGNLIYYTAYKGDVYGQLYRIPLVGGSRTKIADNVDSTPAPSPDG